MTQPSNRKTVALISSYTRSLVTFRGPLLRALVGAGHRVIAYGVERDAETEEQLQALNVEFRTWRLHRAGLNPACDARSLINLTRQLRRDRVEVAITYTMKPNAYGSLAAKLAGVPHIYSMITGLGYAFIGSDRQARLTGRVLSGVLRTAFRFNDKVIVYNQDIEQIFTARGIFRSPDQAIRIGGTGVDLEHFKPAPPAQSPVSFLLIARLLTDKGIREYAAAARKLKIAHPDARFVLVGPYDPNPTGIKPEQVEGWVQEGALEYLGALSDVRPAIRECSVYVLPSYAEGVPRTVQEAMAMGRAVITTDAPGCRDTVEPERTGLLVPPRDADALAAAMERFLLDPALIPKMGAAGRRLAEERFDVGRINQQLLEITGLARSAQARDTDRSRSSAGGG